MRYSKRIRRYLPEAAFLTLIAVCFFIYFVVSMTPSRLAWYREMRNQLVIFYQKVTSVQR